jgi:hypothetical protein
VKLIFGIDGRIDGPNIKFLRNSVHFELGRLEDKKYV